MTPMIPDSEAMAARKPVFLLGRRLGSAEFAPPGAAAQESVQGECAGHARQEVSKKVHVNFHIVPPR